MGFLDDLNSEMAGRICKIQRWLDTLEGEYGDEVREAVNGDYPSKTVWRVIVQREGVIFSESAFARHKKGECSCGIQR